MPYQLHREAAGCAPADPCKLLADFTTGFGSNARQPANDRRGRWTPELFLDRKPPTAFSLSRPAAGVCRGNGESHG